MNILCKFAILLLESIIAFCKSFKNAAIEQNKVKWTRFAILLLESEHFVQDLLFCY